jgi:uncharacterized protein
MEMGGQMENVKRIVMFQSAVGQLKLDPMGIHGPIHWMKVYRNCQDLHVMEHGDEPSHDDDWFYWCFSMLHDCCRTIEGPDPAHGIEAAKLIPDDGSPFNIALARAIKLHQMGKRMDVDAELGYELISICWDADRLELPRVNIIPDPKRMSTKAGIAAAEAYHVPPAGYDPKSDDPRLGRRIYNDQEN